MKKLIMFGFMTATLASVIFIPPVFATGETTCQTTPTTSQAGELAYSASYIEGTRATIEGQALPLCTGSARSASWQWAAIETTTSAHNIAQVGYGRCANENNNLGLGTVCNGGYYYYWAWGSDCGGITDGSDPGWGPVAIRIGAALTSPPATSDYYVLRENIGGIVYYDGYVNGSLLTGVDALGNTVTARVPASMVCWDSDQANRRLYWFGETHNTGDSMGGWTGSTKNHLDYNPMSYTIGSGWNAPSLVASNPCSWVPNAPLYTCTIAASNAIYLDTNR